MHKRELQVYPLSSNAPTSPAKQRRKAMSQVAHDTVADSEEDDEEFSLSVAPSTSGAVHVDRSGALHTPSILQSGIRIGVKSSGERTINASTSGTSQGHSIKTMSEGNASQQIDALSEDTSNGPAGIAASGLASSQGSSNVDGLVGNPVDPRSPSTVLAVEASNTPKKDFVGNKSEGSKNVMSAYVIPAGRVVVDISDSEDEAQVDKLQEDEIMDPDHQKRLAEAKAGKRRAAPEEVPETDSEEQERQSIRESDETPRVYKQKKSVIGQSYAGYEVATPTDKSDGRPPLTLSIRPSAFKRSVTAPPTQGLSGTPPNMSSRCAVPFIRQSSLFLLNSSCERNRLQPAPW